MTDTNSISKKSPKNPIKFLIPLNEEQKQAKSIILDNKITVLKGQAGSGKSMLAAQIALDLLFRKEIDRIILTRPAVTSGEDIGFLPGTKEDKLAPYTAAIYDNMYRLYNKEKIDKELTDGRIEVIPLAFMRGRNLSNCFVVVDEAQNITNRQMELLLGRLCVGTKMIIC
jgi:phosphate starvation-inducible PhoH-like protein